MKKNLFKLFGLMLSLVGLGLSAGAAVSFHP